MIKGAVIFITGGVLGAAFGVTAGIWIALDVFDREAELAKEKTATREREVEQS